MHTPADPPPLVQPKLTLTILFDGDAADIDILQRRSVGDLIRHALAAFGCSDQDVDDCHLAAGTNLFFPHHSLAGTDIESGERLQLRLML